MKSSKPLTSRRRRFWRRGISIALTCGLTLALPGGARATVGEVVQLNSFGHATVEGQYGVAVDQRTGDVYLGNVARNEEGPQAFLFQFAPEMTTSETGIPTSVGGQGAGDGQFEGVSGIAITPGAVPGSIYAIDVGGGRLERFNAETLAYESQFPLAGSPEVGIATDSAGTIYLPNPTGNEIQELTPAGAPGPVPSIKGTGTSALAAPTKVAVDSHGNVYVVDHPGGTGRVEKFNAQGEFQSVLDNGVSEAVAVDPSNDRVWVVDGAPEVSPQGETVNVYDSTGTLIARTASPLVLAPEGEEANVQNIAVSGATHQAFATVRGVGHMERLQAVIPAPPTVDTESASAITQTGATLEAAINPNTLIATYQFQYGLTSSYGLTAPGSPALVGSDSVDHAVTADVGGLTPNTVYSYDVVAENSLGATEGAEQTLLTGPAIPETGGASGLSQTEATIAGSFNPGSHDTRYHFEYGTAACGSTSCGSQTAETEAGSGASAVEPTARLSQLTALTAYHYRLVVSNKAANGGGTAYGPEREFLTPAAPLARTAPPASIGATTAELAGEVTPQDAPTSYRFEYGPTATYGQSAPSPEADAGSGTTGRYVTATIKGLQPNSEYHYRLVASNLVGTGVGVDRTFTTNAAGEPRSGAIGDGFSLTGTAPAAPAAVAYANLAGLAPTPPLTARQHPTLTPLTRAQKLARALKACRKVTSRAKRRKCEKTARGRYQTKAKRRT